MLREKQRGLVLCPRGFVCVIFDYIDSDRRFLYIG